MGLTPWTWLSPLEAFVCRSASQGRCRSWGQWVSHPPVFQKRVEGSDHTPAWKALTGTWSEELRTSSLDFFFKAPYLCERFSWISWRILDRISSGSDYCGVRVMCGLSERRWGSKPELVTLCVRRLSPACARQVLRDVPSLLSCPLPPQWGRALGRSVCDSWWGLGDGAPPFSLPSADAERGRCKLGTF